VACATTPPIHSDTTNESSVNNQFQYLNQTLAESNLKLSTHNEMQHGIVQNGIITTPNGTFAVLTHKSKHFQIVPNFSFATIEDDTAWQQLYGAFYYYTTEKAWHIRHGDTTYHTYPITGTVKWMEAVGDKVQLVVLDEGQYTMQIIDKTGAIIDSTMLNCTKVVSSCDNMFLYTDAGVLRKDPENQEMILTSLPSDAVLLETLQHYIANGQVIAIYYFQPTDTTLHVQYELYENVYEITLPNQYTVAELQWMEWCNGKINLLMDDNTWWSAEAEAPSVVGYEFKKDTTASEWITNHVTELHVINGELLFFADDGYVYRHNSYENGMSAWFCGFHW
jgi:hypothetical protein